MTILAQAGLILVLLLAVGALLGAGAAIRRRRRLRTRLAGIAHDRGLSFTSSHDARVLRRFRDMGWLQVGYNPLLTDLMVGPLKKGRLYCFRYRMDRGFGTHRRVDRGTAAVLQWDDENMGTLGEGPVGQLALPAGTHLDCRGGLISLRLPGEGTESEYAQLLDAGRRLAEEIGNGP